MPAAIPTFKPPRLKPPRKRFAHHYATSTFKAARQAVLLRDLYTCRGCGRVTTNRPQVDHIVPLRAGGTDDLGNLQTLCLRCHATKTRQEMAVY